jgi:hypothetical protein
MGSPAPYGPATPNPPQREARALLRLPRGQHSQRGASLCGFGCYQPVTTLSKEPSQRPLTLQEFRQLARASAPTERLALGIPGSHVMPSVRLSPLSHGPNCALSADKGGRG